MSNFPSRYGHSPLYANPQGTVPAPSPTGIPRPVWGTQWMVVQWVQTDVVDPTVDPLEVRPPGVLYRYTWSSPVFDLRPDLRSSNAGPKDGVPIWSVAARLYVQLAANARGSGAQPALLTPNVNVTATDWVNTTFNFSGARRPTEGVSGGAGLLNSTPTDVTAKFSASGAGVTTTLAGFAPPGSTLGFGEGYPVRFWRLQLTFEQFIETEVPLPDPLPNGRPYVFQASVY